MRSLARDSLEKLPIVWLVALAASAACSGAQTAAPVRSSLNIGSSLPLRVDSGRLPPWVDGAVREPLVSVGLDGRPVERLVERWEWDPDGRTLRLFLHPHLRFHDGTELTAPVAAAIVRRIVKTGGLSFSSITAIEPDGPLAITIRLKEPEAFLLAELADAPLSPDNKPQIGTGPFMVDNVGSTIVVKAFESYHKGRPPLDRIQFLAYPTQRAVWAAMMRGDIDAVHEVSREAVEFVEAESTVRTYSFVRPYYIVLGFNVRHPVLSKAGIRKALNLAIDRDSLITQAMRGRGEPAKGPIWPQNWAYTSVSRSYSFNPEAARLLLDNAGYQVGHEARTGRMPSRFSFTCLLWAGDPRFERHALVVQKQLYDIGIDMEIVPVDTEEWVSRLATGRFDAFLSEQTSGRSLVWTYKFFHSPPPGAPVFLASGYTAADEPLDRLRRALNEEQTRAAVADLQSVLYEDPPAVFLAWPQGSRAVRQEFEVVPSESTPDIMGSLWQWRYRSGQVASR